MESFLLQALGEHEITINDLGTFELKNDLIVILTSNSQRSLLDETKDRCLFLYIPYPTVEREIEIVKSKLPEANDETVSYVVKLVHDIRNLNLMKKPSVRGTVDWVKSISNLGTKNFHTYTLSAQLREQGLPVSVRSTQAAFEIYQNLGDDDRNLLKTAMMAVYVKDKYDIPKFNKIFEKIFKKAAPDNEIPQKDDSTKAYKGKGPKSNKYIIKKQGNMGQKIRQEKIDNNKLKMLSGQPLLEEAKKLERDGELMNKDLTKLNRFDPRMLEICQRLGKRIANKRSRRKVQSNSHKLDIRKTIRANLKYGGVPFELIMSKPRPHKNEHLFLNDISGSCEWISSWFFMLMFSAQTAFKRSRTFEFDNKVIETTKALKEEYLIDSFVKVKDLRVKNLMVHGTSNMYTAFQQFQEIANINNKSYVIILSDCRDWAGPKVNGVPASVGLVEEMVRDAKKVIILNPEDRDKWDIVDSCVSLYEDAGAHVFEVNTLNQLAQFVEQM